MVTDPGTGLLVRQRRDDRIILAGSGEDPCGCCGPTGPTDPTCCMGAGVPVSCAPNGAGFVLAQSVFSGSINLVTESFTCCSGVRTLAQRRTLSLPFITGANVFHSFRGMSPAACVGVRLRNPFGRYRTDNFVNAATCAPNVSTNFSDGGDLYWANDFNQPSPTIRTILAYNDFTTGRWFMLKQGSPFVIALLSTTGQEPGWNMGTVTNDASNCCLNFSITGANRSDNFVSGLCFGQVSSTINVDLNVMMNQGNFNHVAPCSQAIQSLAPTVPEGGVVPPPSEIVLPDGGCSGCGGGTGGLLL